jgi:hypothetical protein
MEEKLLKFLLTTCLLSITAIASSQNYRPAQEQIYREANLRALSDLAEQAQYVQGLRQPGSNGGHVVYFPTPVDPNARPKLAATVEYLPNPGKLVYLNPAIRNSNTTPALITPRFLCVNVWGKYYESHNPCN